MRCIALASTTSNMLQLARLLTQSRGWAVQVPRRSVCSPGYGPGEATALRQPGSPSAPAGSITSGSSVNCQARGAQGIPLSRALGDLFCRPASHSRPLVS